MVHAGRIVRYKVSVYPTSKYAKAKKAPTGAQGAASPILNLRVMLPVGVTYHYSKTLPALYTSDPLVRKAKRQPVQSDGATVLTWEDIGATCKGRKFRVKVRVDPATASGTLLTFAV